MNKNILFVSYFAGVDANCPAEWADDRLRSMESLGDNIVVLTNYGSNLKCTERIKIVRVPSISSDDFSHELNLRGGRKAIGGLGIYPLIALVFVFGSIFQALTKLLTRGGTGGKWSWLVCAIPSGLWLGLTKRIDVIYCTGGPPSAYLVGLVVSWMTRAPLKIELQDPLVGAEIDQSTYKQRMVRLVERTLLKHADLCVYVTKKAAHDSQKRNPEFKNKIIHNYPASWNFSVHNSPAHEAYERPVKILHLGTLYGSRNLDKFFMALDELYAEECIAHGDVQITNLGSVYTSNAREYVARGDFNLLAERKRTDALKMAKEADYLLLVQHDDRRSVETIPYKIYDYLNMNIPVIMLIKNHEIGDLCPCASKLMADCSDKVQIKSAIRAAVKICGSDEYINLRRVLSNQYDLQINQQVANIIY